MRTWSTTIAYDIHNLLVESVEDALGNVVAADNDYRILGPTLTTDPSGNQTEAAFDELGRVVAVAVKGKEGGPSRPVAWCRPGRRRRVGLARDGGARDEPPRRAAGREPRDGETASCPSRSSRPTFRTRRERRRASCSSLTHPVGWIWTTDGQVITWIETPPKDPLSENWPPGELWVSPFSSDPAALTPTFVRSVPALGSAYSVIGEGYYAVATRPPANKPFTWGIIIYRLADGAQWVYDIPDVDGLLRHLNYIDADSIWFEVQPGGIYRQQLSALGPGSPP